MVRMATEFETNVVSVERIKEYSETPTEAAWEAIDASDAGDEKTALVPKLTKPSPDWPHHGKVISGWPLVIVMLEFAVVLSVAELYIMYFA